MVTLRQALLSCPVGQLNKMVREYALRVDATTLRPELVAALRDTIAEQAAYADFWTSLGSAERAAAGIVSRSERGVEADTLLRRLAAEMRSGTRPGMTEPMIDTVEVTRLLDRGLLYRMFNTDGPARGTFLVMPDELRILAERHVGVASPLVALALDVAPTDVRRADPVHDLFVLASALRREAWNAAARSMVGRPERRLDDVLARLPAGSATEDRRARRERWSFLVELGRRDGWLRGGAWPTPVDLEVHALLSGSERAVERLWRAHLGVPSRGGPAARLDPVAEHGMAQALAEVGTGTRFDVVALVDALARTAGAAAPPARRPPGAAPVAGEAGALERVLGGPWFWLGLVARGRRGDAWSLVETAPGLQIVAGRAPAAGETAPVRCRAGDDLALVAPLGADLAALYEAEPYLAFERIAPDGRHYRLTAGSFARGCRHGGTADVFLALVGRLVQGEVPAPWREAVDEWSSSARRLRVAARVVIEADAADDLHRAWTALGEGADALDVISERHAAIRPDALGDVLRRLGDAGLAVDVAPELRLEGRRPERAAALAGEGTDLIWVILETLRRLDPELVARDAGLASLASALDAVIPTHDRSALERRAAALAAHVVERRRQRPRTRPGGRS